MPLKYSSQFRAKRHSPGASTSGGADGPANADSTPAQPIHPVYNEVALSYKRKKDGNFADLAGNAKHHVLKQVRTGLDSLQKFMDSSGQKDEDKAKVKTLLTDFYEDLTVNNKFSNQDKELLGPAKEQLDQFVIDVNNNKIAKATRIESVKEFAEGLGVCAPGVATNIKLTSNKLHLVADGSVSNYVEAKWQSMLMNAITDFARATHKSEAYYRNNEIHYINAYFNYLANDYGLEEQKDDFVTLSSVTPESLQRCKQELAKSLSADRLIDYLADECLQELRGFVQTLATEVLGAESAGTPITPQHVPQVLEALEPKLEEMQSRYGPLSLDLWLEPLSDDLNTSYRLTDNATLIARAIAKNLAREDVQVFDPKPTTRVHGSKSDAFTIKSVGDVAFYSKTKGPHGRDDQQLQPLLPADLQKLGQQPNPKLTQAALDNARTAAHFNALSADQVWSAWQQLQGHGLPALIEQFASPSARRYRAAASQHDAALKAKLLDLFESHSASPEVWQDGLIAGMKHGEDSLVLEKLRGVSYFVLNGVALNPQFVDAAIQHACNGTLAKLLERMVALDRPRVTNGWQLLKLACVSGNHEALAMLLKHGANPEGIDEHRATALMHASEKNHLSCVELLLKNADAGAINARNAGGQTALWLAVFGGHAKVVAALLERQADKAIASFDGYTPLMVAAEKGQLDCVNYLIGKGDLQFINARGRNGATAMFVAALNGHAEVVAALLKSQADRMLADNSGNTPLMLAAHCGHVDCANHLLDKSDLQSINARNEDGATALLAAALNGHAEVVAALLKSQADRMLADNGGNTPLMLAARTAAMLIAPITCWTNQICNPSTHKIKQVKQRCLEQLPKAKRRWSRRSSRAKQIECLRITVVIRP